MAEENTGGNVTYRTSNEILEVELKVKYKDRETYIKHHMFIGSFLTKITDSIVEVTENEFGT